jgi:FkbM family methyltransferase
LYGALTNPNQRYITEGDLRDARDNAFVRAMMRKTLKRDSACVDIGAHCGFFLGQFFEFAPDGRHYAFEPIPGMFSDLSRRFPRAEVFDCALSDHNGEAGFLFVPELPGWSGLRPHPYPFRVHPQEILVKLRKLDDVIPLDVHVAFIKIDVEGAELEVLRGSTEILRRCRPIVYFECAKIHHAHYGTTPEVVHQLLAECGLGVFLLDETPLSLQAFAADYEASYRSGYDRTAWQNYFAMPI